MQIPFFEVTEVYDLLFVSTEQWPIKLYTFKKTPKLSTVTAVRLKAHN